MQLSQTEFLILYKRYGGSETLLEKLGGKTMGLFDKKETETVP